MAMEEVVEVGTVVMPMMPMMIVMIVMVIMMMIVTVLVLFVAPCDFIEALDFRRSEPLDAYLFIHNRGVVMVGIDDDEAPQTLGSFRRIEG
jgi:hypothetical protein